MPCHKLTARPAGGGTQGAEIAEKYLQIGSGLFACRGVLNVLCPTQLAQARRAVSGCTGEYAPGLNYGSKKETTSFKTCRRRDADSLNS
jgi:hypothetical protein